MLLFFTLSIAIQFEVIHKIAKIDKRTASSSQAIVRMSGEATQALSEAFPYEFSNDEIPTSQTLYRN